MRTIHDMGWKFGAHHVETGLVRIAQQRGHLRAVRAGDVLPMHIGRRDSDEARIVLGGTHHGGRDEHQSERRKPKIFYFHACPAGAKEPV
jgi:hypothetical protein